MKAIPSLLLLSLAGCFSSDAAESTIAQNLSPPAASFDWFWSPALTNAAPLKVEVLATNEIQGVAIERIRYTASSWQGQPQRVFALYAHPKGLGPFPAILQIHGGGQTCYPENVVYFVKRGYACLSFDWTGPRTGRPDDSVTHWAKPIQGNYFGADGQDAHDVLIYHATLAAIRGIDLLASRPEVAPGRIGVQGISWGGFLTWLVNGLDARIKAAVPVYGVGDQDLQWNDMGTALHTRSPQMRSLWRGLFDPVSFAGRQHGPVMYLDGANDFFGPQDLAEQRLGELRVAHRRSYSPNRMHNLDERSVAAGMAWLEAHLKSPTPRFPAEPEVVFETNDAGEFVASVTPDTSRRIRSVHFDFSRGDQLPLLRCWLSIEARLENDGRWRAAIPLVDATQRIAVMAQVVYDPGVMLSSVVHEFRPAVKLTKRPRAQSVPRDTIIDASDTLGGMYIPTGTDFTHADPPPARLTTGEIDGRRAFICEPVGAAKSIRIATRRMVDPATRAGGTAQLEIWTHDVARMQVRLNFFLREPGAEEYEATVTPGAGWQRRVLSLSDFAPFNEEKGKVETKHGRPLANWNEVHQIELICEPATEGKVALNRMGWIRNEVQP